MKLHQILTPLFAVTLIGCTQPQCATFTEGAGPALETVMARVDVPRLLECRKAGAPREVAICLGAEALTQGLQFAINRASSLADDARAASNPGAGAADMTEAGRTQLGGELDAAMEQLAQEIAATHISDAERRL